MGAAMDGDRRLLTTAVRLLAGLAVVATLGAGVGAAVVQAGEDGDESPSRSGAQTSPAEVGDPFASGTDGFDYRTWVIQDDSAGISYRVPPASAGWRVIPADDEVEAKDADGAVVARGKVRAYYYGNACSGDDGRAVSGAWTLLAEPVEGADPSAAAEDAVIAWSRSFVGGGTSIPDPRTDEVELADGTTGVRSWVSLDLRGFTGSCLPDRAEVAVTTVARGSEMVSLVQGRYVLGERGVTDADWSAISASLRVE